MTEFEDIPFDPHAFNERLEAYLDGVMADDERAAFVADLANNPQLADEVALQARLDASLVRAFPRVVAPAAHLAVFEKYLSSALDAGHPATIKFPWPWVAGMAAVAAAACLAFVTWNFNTQSGKAPYFAPVPLAQIYNKTVDEGFEPYYECRDDERFAKTFQLRQGVPLQLATLPTGSMMKGLSYPGGLSRETTAMLCDVNGEPVMVFVDREERDQKLAVKNSDPDVNVFREQRDGLVFYEVTPLDEPMMTQYLQVAE
jgi:hypothetical protein